MHEERMAFGWVLAGIPMPAFARIGIRLLSAVLWILICYALSWGGGRAWRKRISRAWVHGLRGIIGLQVFWRGTPPGKPYFLVTNHLTWQDFFVLVCTCDATIVVQAADDTIPLVGRLMVGLGVIPAPCPGGDASRCVEQMVSALQKGESLVMAPEGIVGPGREVRTFHPELLEAAVRTTTPVHYLSFTYRTPTGYPPPSQVVLFGPDPMFRTSDGRIPESELAAWGPERPFFPHVLGVLSLPRHEIIVRFGDVSITGENADTLAADLRAAVQTIFAPVP